MEITVTLKVELVKGERLSVGALNWVKFNLTKEFVQILSDTVPGEVLVKGLNKDRSPIEVDENAANDETLLKYKIAPLFSNRTISDYLR